MVRNLDSLITFLLDEIALCGEQGTYVRGLIYFTCTMSNYLYDWHSLASAVVSMQVCDMEWGVGGEPLELPCFFELLFQTVQRSSPVPLISGGISHAAAGMTLADST